jgi:hypothetical protein
VARSVVLPVITHRSSSLARDWRLPLSWDGKPKTENWWRQVVDCASKKAQFAKFVSENQNLLYNFAFRS